MNLIVDIGNTRAKIAVMEGGRVVKSLNIERFEHSILSDLSGEFSLERAILCSTKGQQEALEESVREVVGHCLVFDADTPIPIPNSYSTPETLGRDRLAAAVGATVLSDLDNQLVIDLGTAITIDLVTRRGGFEGGVISPGVTMRFRALHEFTAGLPLCSATDSIIDVARTTSDAIEHGVMEGILFEIGGHIAKNREKFEKIDVIFAGGDLKYFENRIKNTIFASSELVFVGLNRILEYNA
ncbi:MAG: type III pantothenate kinase [Rikenellaceae bacterium]